MHAKLEASCLEDRLEQHRGELTSFCRRMLGPSEAEDAVQETLVRAWRGFGCFEGRAPLRSWLYRIATNICLDVLEGRKRRGRPVDLGLADTPAPREAVREGRDPADRSAEDAVLARESVRLALGAALQHLPPKQRTVLILREVLRWRASEVADLLGTSVPAINSALQRARATLEAADTSPTTARPADAASAELLSRYVDAFERCDVDALMSVLHEEGTRRGRRCAGVLRAPRRSS
jgi:RNA polymerase sigma-70 factor, ECF subfamily